MLAVDTETTGADFHHGSRPFFVSTCDHDQNLKYWEWDVDPLTRMPAIPEEDINEVWWWINSQEQLCLHNAPFDVKALSSISPLFCELWPWYKTDDTIVQSHILCSSWAILPRNLTDMVMYYCGMNIEPLEKAIKAATEEARRMVRLKANQEFFEGWMLGKKDQEDMPSVKDKTWQVDMWLPRAVAKKMNYPEDHPWWTVLSDYANGDTAATVILNQVCKIQLEERGLTKQYLERMKLPKIIVDMEQHGVTVNSDRLTVKEREFRAESEKHGKVCVAIADSYGYELNLPKGSKNNSLDHFCFGKPIKDEAGFEVGREQYLNLPMVARTKTGNPSLNKTSIDLYLNSDEYGLRERSKQYTFIKHLADKRRRDTAIGYMTSYRKFWVSGDTEGYHLLYPSLNMVGTDTLRMTSSNPNQQQVSKQESVGLREVFGPEPDEEWWTMDAKNIELRLPAYEAGETEMIKLFERPDDAPYYGSYHLLVFDTLHPEKFAKHGIKCKDVYDSTWYQWTKNGNFAVQYGAIESSGTADRAYHVPGAQKIIQGRFKNIAKLNQRQIEFARKHGYVETMPDRTVDPSRGYPLICTRTEDGNILPTVPLNYHTQGTAMWWMCKAMIRCHAQLEEWNRKEGRRGRDRYRIIMQVHDELAFRFPKRANPKSNPKGSNLWRARILQKLMAEGGNDIGVPTPVSCKYHDTSWAHGLAC